MTIAPLNSDPLKFQTHDLDDMSEIYKNISEIFKTTLSSFTEVYSVMLQGYAVSNVTDILSHPDYNLISGLKDKEGYSLIERALIDKRVEFAFFLAVNGFEPPRESLVKSYDELDFLLKAARIYVENENYQKAISYFLLVIAKLEKSEGSDLLVIANILKELGRAYRHQQNDVAAIESYTKALGLIKQVLGTYHLNVGDLLIEMGYMQLKQGNHLKGIESLEEALRIFKEGDLDSDLSLFLLTDVLDILGKAYKKQKQYEKAVECFNHKLFLQLKMKKPSTYSVSQTAFLQGVCYQDAGNSRMAKRMFVFSIRTAQGDVSRKQASLYELAFCCIEERNYSKALKYLMKSLKIVRATWPGDSPKIAEHIIGIDHCRNRLEAIENKENIEG